MYKKEYKDPITISAAYGALHKRIVSTVLTKIRSILFRRIMAQIAIYRIMRQNNQDMIMLEFNKLSICAPKTKEHAFNLYAVISNNFEPFTMNLFDKVIKPGVVVLDIGANIGVYTLLACQRLGSRGKVFSFEPDPYAYQWLLQNIHLNGFEDRVIAVNKAVSVHEGKTCLFCTRGTGRSSLVTTKGVLREQSEQIEVETITIDNFINKSTEVGVIKMDIEGAEALALQGMVETIARSPHLSLFTEFAPRGIRMSGYSPVGFVKCLQDLGFRVFVIDEQNRRLYEVGPLSEIELLIEYAENREGYVNLFCTKSSSVITEMKVD